MHLNKNSWYVRWYFWSLEICCQFLDNGNMMWRAEQKGTNLCAFMRVIIIYAPLILLLHAIVYAGALAAITIWPIYLFGLKGYGLGMGALVALVALIVGIVLLVMWLNKTRKARTANQGQKIKQTAVNSIDPGFFRIMGRWVVAKKRKICPLITFVEHDKEVRQ